MGKSKLPKGRERLDQLMVDLGLVAELKEAVSLIMAGKVIVNDHRIDKPGTLIDRSSNVRLKMATRYASRGGDKLAGAVMDLAIEGIFKGKVVLDVGASTGGFTDYCLRTGAEHVVAVDVGTNQLAWELRTDPRVTVKEKTDIKDFNSGESPAIDIVVGDLSFIALERIAGSIIAAAGDKAEDFILLVKPQFELPVDFVPEGGVVVDDIDRGRALKSACEAFESLGLDLQGSADSRVSGASGNREIFVWFKRKKPV